MAWPRSAIVSARAVLTLLVSLFAASSLLGAVAQNLASDRAALLALRDALDPGRRLPWDPTSPSPCNGQWRGVACDALNSRVVELHLPGKSLTGAIPLGTLGNLTALRKLSLRFSAVCGAIPADVGNCAQLRGMFLRGNRLTGEFPEGLFDLAGNRITGGVPVWFNRLKQLDTLFLEGNDLGGAIPAGLNISNLAPGRFNVSFNEKLTGPMPASLERMPATAFLGMRLCGGPLPACAALPPVASPPESPPPPSDGGDSKKGERLSRWKIAGIIVGVVLVLGGGPRAKWLGMQILKLAIGLCN